VAKEVKMRQAKFSVTAEQLDFLSEHRRFGYKDKSTMVRKALQNLREELERKELEASADLYAEIYAEDAELQALTEAAVNDWPE
jgi:Arc/MetJ-type ribon-helix-helix transcriptional regulator